jgi:hypothetical protein
VSCSICAKIPASLSANTGRDDYLPAETRPLERRKDHYSSIGTDEDLWECPECGAFYIYTTETAFTGSGNNDTDTLDRLTDEQSGVVRAMLDCKADPVAVEDVLFALPEIALELALSAACVKDRDFVALFIPRLVHEYVKRGQGQSYTKHPARDTLYRLIAANPRSFAREVLAATTALPPELRARLGDLERRCQS